MRKSGRGRQPKIYVVSNPYRFVFLDGCAAAETRSWANAFGIFNISDELENDSVIGAQAFVGYARDHTKSWRAQYTSSATRD
jgi:hypothetical protein